jgi:competence protein ComEC
VSAWRIALSLLAAFALSWGSTGWRAAVYASDALDPVLEGRDVLVTGQIVAMPQHSDAGWRLRFEVEHAELEGQAARLPQRLDLGWYKPWGAEAGTANLPSLQASERWQFMVRLKAPHGSRNPHGFDMELWLWEQGVGANGYVRAGPKDFTPRKLGQTWSHPLERTRQAVRDRILAQANSSSDSDMSRRLYGVVAALVVGDQQAISREDWDVFRATGVAHLMSISGLHITLFAWLMGMMTARLWRMSARLCLACPAPMAAAVSGLCLASLYALFSGWGVPAQRTVCMLAVAVLLRLGGLRWPWHGVWLLAAVVVLLIDPWAMLQAGFWLSFVAVGVLFAGSWGLPTQRGWLGQLRSMGREQLIITLALTPLTLLLFGQVSLVGLLANALAIPWVTLLVTPLSLLGVLWQPLWGWAHTCLEVLSEGLGWLAAWPWAIVSVPQAPLWAGMAGVLGGLMLVMRWPWVMRLAGLPLMLPVLLWQAPRPDAEQFSVLAADVGQGNAVLVQTATHDLLFDAGPRYSVNSDAGHRVLLPLMRVMDVRLDTLVLSHRDADHTGGAVAVLGQQPQAQVLSSIESGHALQDLRPALRCEAGQRWVWDQVTFEVLHPTADDYDTERKANGLSCVLRISNGQHTVLLTGDIEKPQETRLLSLGDALRADVLLVPHHGSKTSSSDAFLDAVSPRLALVQAGYRNRYGHPAPAVMARYNERGIAVFDSPRCGAAAWSSTQPDKVDCERVMHRRYWQHEW